MFQLVERIAHSRGWLVFGTVTMGVCFLLIGVIGLVFANDKRPLPPWEFEPAWSPDGTRIAYCTHDGCITINADGSYPQNIANTSLYTDRVVWSPNGELIASCGDNQCFVSDPDGNSILELPNVYGSTWPNTESFVWSPDSERIVMFSDRDGNDEIYVVVVDSGDLTRLTNDSDDDYDHLAWSPDGSRISFTADITNWTIIDTSSGKRLNPADPDFARHGAWSSDGTQIAVSFLNRVYLLDADGNNPIILTDAMNEAQDAAWSPDGTQIVFTSNPSGGSGEIYVINTDGTGLTRLNGDVEHLVDNPAWSPDGTRIAFTGDQGYGTGWIQLFVVNSDGSNLKRLTTNGEVESFAWSPDGSRIVFEVEHNDRTSIYLIDPDGENLVKLTGKDISDLLRPFE